MYYIFLLCRIISNGQNAQYVIGTNNEEIATHIRLLNDGNLIVSGYTYIRNSHGVPTQLDILIFKMDLSGNIIWQKQIGSKNGNDDNPLDMIVAKNGDIILVGTVGRTSVFQNNTAFIMRIDPTNGAVIWNSFFADATSPNEAFLSVAETQAMDLVCVGAYSFGPPSNQGLICVYDQFGNLKSSMVANINSTGEFYGVTAGLQNDPNVYISGINMQAGATSVDGILLAFLPNTNLISWVNVYDFTQHGNKTNNFFSHLYHDKLKNSLTVGYSSLSQGISAHGLLTTDITGNSERFYDFYNTTYYTPLPALNISANSSSIGFVNQNELYMVENPYSTYSEAIVSGTGTYRDATISHITNLSNKQFGNKKYLFRENTINRSIFDIHVNSNTELLYMAGYSNEQTKFKQDNILIYLTVNDLSITDCSFVPIDSLTDIPFIKTTPNWFTYSPNVNNKFNIIVSDANLQSYLACGDIISNKQTLGEKMLLTKLNDLRLFPQPAKDKLTINLSSPLGNSGTAIITDLLGNVILKQNLSANQQIIELNTTQLTNGVYTIRVLSDKISSPIVRKFTILH